MGTWNTSIKGNDASSDIYSDFFDLYNDGKNPVEISKILFTDYQEVLDNPHDWVCYPKTIQFRNRLF